MTRLRLAVFVLMCALLVTVAAAAQADPPSRVARLNYISGEVSFQPGGVEDWTSADLNRPLTTADRLWTDREARAELHIGSTAVRLGEETSFTLANLDDHSVQIQLAQGTLNFRVRSLGEDDTFEVDTPNLTFIVLHPGEYRVNVDNEGQTSWVVVRAGTGDLAGKGQRLTLRAGQQARFSETGDEAEVTDAARRDEFDEWCLARNRNQDEVQSARYVSPEVTGYEDLDRNGDWYQEAGYGAVWVPRGVAEDWAPYRYGHWAWVFPWGWTWIDDAPWGFAPFHYGRWVHVRRGWAWIPGPRMVRPVYAPALVAWVGGNNWGVGISVGQRPVGWFPLGPREVYVPAYQSSRTYVTNVNVTNTTVTNVTVINVYENNRGNRVFVNQHVRGAVTAVPEDALIHARPVHREVLKVREEDIRRVKVVNTVAVAPDHRSVLGRDENPRHAPPERVVTRPVVSRTPPPRAVPFEAQRRAVANDGTIRPDRVKDFPEMRRPQNISPDKPGRAEDGMRGRTTPLPVHRAENDKNEARPDRDLPRNADEPERRPGARNVPRPENSEDRARGRRDDVAGPPQDRGNSQRRVVPRPPQQDNKDTRTPDAVTRDVPRLPQERANDPAQPRDTHAVAPPAHENRNPHSPETTVRDVPRPQQERANDPAQPREPRMAARPPQEIQHASEPAAREVPRPQQERPAARPADPPRSEPARPAVQRSEPARPAPQRVEAQPRVARSVAAPQQPKQEKEKAAPTKADDKSKDKKNK